MAKNVTLMGASYPDVPAVNLPQTGGGTATFTDVTGTTATAADVAQGKVFYAADGTETTGTASGGSATIEPLSVTANGTYNPPSGVDGYSPVVVNVPSGGGGGGSASDPVKFIDYDGTILHSYSVSDFMALTALPENPSHSGLTAQGWNWSLADAKSQLTAYPEAGLTIGQMYITDDGKTRIYVHFEEARKSPYFGICPKGTVTVDWGDGSATDTLTGTSLTTVKTVQHEFPSAGDYVITLTVESGSFAFYGVSNTSHILKKSTSTSASVSRVYTNAVQKIELGTGANLGNYAFSYCMSLKTITIPSSVTNIKTYAFVNCFSLLSITIPDGVTSIESSTFYACYSLLSITIPNGVMSIGNSAFSQCYSLSSLTIPNSVTSIGGNVFSSCTSLPSLTIPNSVTSIGTSAFISCSSLSSLTIPDGITNIEANAFSSCYSLSSLTIPNSVTSIGNSAFTQCSSLSSLTIPNSVTSIGTNAFSSCYGMKEYHFLPTTPPTLASTNAFNNIQSDCIIYVPQGCLEAYQTATNFSNYASYMQEEPT